MSKIVEKKLVEKSRKKNSSNKFVEKIKFRRKNSSKKFVEKIRRNTIGIHTIGIHTIGTVVPLVGGQGGL